MNTKDYLHLYLGCEVIGTYNDDSGSRGYLTGVTNGGEECEIQFFLEDGINVSESPEFSPSSDVKLILRPFTDITQDEVAELMGLPWSIKRANYNKPFFQCEYEGPQGDTQFKHLYHNQLNPQQFLFLLSKHFDLFNLIEAGLAIDATTVKDKINQQ